MKELTQRQLQILDFIHRHPGGMSQNELARVLGIGPKAVFDHIEYMSVKGVVRKTYATTGSIIVTDYGRYQLMLRGLADSVCPTVTMRQVAE